jgi:hypothetical protein
VVGADFLWPILVRLMTDELSGERFTATGGGNGRFCLGDAGLLREAGLCGVTL